MALKKIKVKIQSLEESFKEDREFAKELDKGIYKVHTPKLTFEDYDTYKKMLTQNRLDLLQVIRAKKPGNIKQLATLAKRDFKNVYEDIKMLENLGLVELKKKGKSLMPVVAFEKIELHIEIPLDA